MAERHASDQSLAAAASAVRRGHVGFGPGLVDEDQPPRIEAFPAPGRTSGLDVGTVELGGRQRLFLRVISSRAKNRRIEP